MPVLARAGIGESLFCAGRMWQVFELVGRLQRAAPATSSSRRPRTAGGAQPAAKRGTDAKSLSPYWGIDGGKEARGGTVSADIVGRDLRDGGRAGVGVVGRVDRAG